MVCNVVAYSLSCIYRQNCNVNHQVRTRFARPNYLLYNSLLVSVIMSTAGWLDLALQCSIVASSIKTCQLPQALVIRRYSSLLSGGPAHVSCCSLFSNKPSSSIYISYSRSPTDLQIVLSSNNAHYNSLQQAFISFLWDYRLNNAHPPMVIIPYFREY